jgi:hypothetical protein
LGNCTVGRQVGDMIYIHGTLHDSTLPTPIFPALSLCWYDSHKQFFMRCTLGVECVADDPKQDNIPEMLNVNIPCIA